MFVQLSILCSFAHLPEGGLTGAIFGILQSFSWFSFNLGESSSLNSTAFDFLAWDLDLLCDLLWDFKMLLGVFTDWLFAGVPTCKQTK